MTTEKIRVSASSVISSVADTSATPARWRPIGDLMRGSVPFDCRMAIVLRRAFVAASLAWALLLVAVPFLASRAHPSALATATIVAVYAIGSLVCHQLPERSYRLWTAQMPVCARCAGIYAGATIAAIAALGVGAGPPIRRARLILAGAVAPTLLTLVYEWATGRMPANTIRFAAGLSIGVGVAWLLVAASEDQVN